MSFRIAAGAAALILACTNLAAAQMSASTPGAMAPVATGPSLTIKLNTQNASGESGTATLTPVDGGVMVSVKIAGEPADVPQPMHIHTGSCANLGGVKYPLANVVNGVSVTPGARVATTIADLLAAPFAINVHKSTTEISVYVACGDITKPK
jgi:hypothetical protein